MKTDTAVMHVKKKRWTKARVGKLAVSIARGLLMFGLCFMIIQPIITRFCTSVMEEKDLYDSTIVLLPRNVTMQNFKDAINLLDLPTSMLNTMWISLVVALLQVISCTIVAYGFARYEFPLKKFWFACTVMMIIIPPQTIAAPLNSYFGSFDFLGLVKLFNGGKPKNLLNSMTPYMLMSLTCMGLKNGLYIYMLRQYFRGVPKSLEEAAYIDGCGTLHTFTKIMLPDAVPIIMSCFLFAFVWQWTDLFYTRNFLPVGMSIFSKKLSNMVSQMAYYFSKEAGGRSITIPAARSQQFISIGVVFCSTPLIILYCFTQKTFVKSLAMTGSKE